MYTCLHIYNFQILLSSSYHGVSILLYFIYISSVSIHFNVHALVSSFFFIFNKRSNTKILHRIFKKKSIWSELLKQEHRKSYFKKKNNFFPCTCKDNYCFVVKWACSGYFAEWFPRKVLEHCLNAFRIYFQSLFLSQRLKDFFSAETWCSYHLKRHLSREIHSLRTTHRGSRWL